MEGDEVLESLLLLLCTSLGLLDGKTVCIDVDSILRGGGVFGADLIMFGGVNGGDVRETKGGDREETVRGDAQFFLFFLTYLLLIALK